MLSVSATDDGRVLLDEDGRFLVKVRRFSELAKTLSGGVFVVASGPSTASFPVNKYRNYPFIAMNGSILACTAAGVTPYFYLCDDDGVARERTDYVLQGLEKAEHVAMSLEVFSILYEADNECLRDKSVFLLERVNRFVGKPRLTDRKYAWSIRKDAELFSSFSLFRRTPNRIGFSMNMDKGYFVARTIPYVALQLSCQLGFSRVFLVGVDMSQSKGRFYESGDGAYRSSLDDDYDKVILPSFRLVARKIIRAGGFEVYNLSASSRVPASVFPKIDISALDTLLV